MTPADVAATAQQLEGQAWYCSCLMTSAAADAVAGAVAVCPLDAGSAAEIVVTALTAADAAELGCQGRLCLVPSWALHGGHSSWLGTKEYLCMNSIEWDARRSVTKTQVRSSQLWARTGVNTLPSQQVETQFP